MLEKRGAYPKSDMFCQEADRAKGAMIEQIENRDLRIAQREGTANHPVLPPGRIKRLASLHA
jgi:hypothetical protein